MNAPRYGTLLVMLTAASAVLGASFSLLAQDPADRESSEKVRIMLDPELREFAKRFEAPGGNLVLTDENLIETRQAADFYQPPIEKAPVEERMAPGRAGEPPVKVFVINAKPGKKSPGLIYLHGGGYVLGSAEGSLRPAQEIAGDLDIPVVSVDYRLAPETTYRGSIEDNYSALLWMRDHADELGVDPARIGVLGVSAGGGHAALLAIAARDRGEISLAFQALIYPMLDDRTGSTRKTPAHIGTLAWTAQANRFGWKSFLGMEPGGEDAPAAAVPARTPSLAKLPPTFIVAGALDLLVIENIEYAQRLTEDAVPTELLVLPGAPHGFIRADRSSAARHANLALRNALRRGLSIGAAQWGDASSR